MFEPRRVLFLEMNELTWTIIDPLIKTGSLPNFARMKRESAWAAPDSVERPPHLDPWITWVTVHTGVDRSVHGANVLEQDASTINADRTWDYVSRAGKSVGIFGSIGAYPPPPLAGFVVPGPFAPGNEVFPAYVAPVQELNRMYTQIHHKNARGGSAVDLAKLGFQLLGLGLSPRTCARITKQLALEKVDPSQHWRRVALQPLVNFDFFEKLYRRYRPHYATWHTNHAAHYMHHYWRAWDDSKFLAPSPEDEKRKYAEAVPYGYQICDELLGRFLSLVDDDTVVVVATSMGQQPYVSELFPEGRIVVRFKDMPAAIELLGIEGVTEMVPTMVPQWNLRIPADRNRARAKRLFEDARVEGGVRANAFSVEENGDILTVTPGGLDKRDPSLRYFFPGAKHAKAGGHALEELFVCDTPTPKQGMHHPTGVLFVRGKGIRQGIEMHETTNLDILPTVLTMMGIEVPKHLPGRVLSEAWEEAGTRRPAA